MHLGLMIECETRVGATEIESLEEAFALTEIAEACGLDGVWLAERHFSSPARIQEGASGGVASVASAPLILASAMGARSPFACAASRSGSSWPRRSRNRRFRDATRRDATGRERRYSFRAPPLRPDS